METYFWSFSIIRNILPWAATCVGSIDSHLVGTKRGLIVDEGISSISSWKCGRARLENELIFFEIQISLNIHSWVVFTGRPSIDIGFPSISSSSS
jgi:hypothetical protein